MDGKSGAAGPLAGVLRGVVSCGLSLSVILCNFVPVFFS